MTDLLNCLSYDTQKEIIDQANGILDAVRYEIENSDLQENDIPEFIKDDLGTDYYRFSVSEKVKIIDNFSDDYGVEFEHQTGECLSNSIESYAAMIANYLAIDMAASHFMENGIGNDIDL